MRKFWILAAILTTFITGCSTDASASAEDIAKLAYEWEKANFDRDYDREQKLIFKEGSYEIHKTTKPKESGLRYEDIRYEIYYDSELEKYYVFADFKNPNGENKVEENIVLRKKDEQWKVDTEESLNINREVVSEKFEREACIHCK